MSTVNLKSIGGWITASEVILDEILSLRVNSGGEHDLSSRPSGGRARSISSDNLLFKVYVLLYPLLPSHRPAGPRQNHEETQNAPYNPHPNPPCSAPRNMFPSG